MDFSTIVVIVIVIGVLGTIGPLVFWVAIAYFGTKAVQDYQNQINSMMNSYSSSVSNLHRNYGNDIPPELQQQIFSQYMNAQYQMRQIDQLSQSRQDNLRSSMLSQASSAGIDVSDW